MSFWNPDTSKPGAARSRTILVGVIPVLSLWILIGLPSIPGLNIDLTVPYAAEGQGPTFNTLGTVDGTDVVDITGTDVDATSGNLNMTTVAIRHNMTLPQALNRWLTTDDRLVPLEQIFPAGMSAEEVKEQNEQAFSVSESSATMAAMNYLNKPMEVVVSEVTPDSPAEEKIQPEDILVEMDAQKIRTPQDIVNVISDKKVGDEVSVTLRRQKNDSNDSQGKEITEKITLAEMPEPVRRARQAAGLDTGPFLGIGMTAQPADGIRVTYHLEDIGGPSAGLIFSLAVIDKLSPGQLTGGKFIAGTGTVDDEGKVGPIGGITYKIAAATEAGAEVFLVPEENCAEALSRNYHKDGRSPELIKVDSVSQAVEQLNKWNSGQEIQRCTS